MAEVISRSTAIELKNISKTFGSVHANKGINLSVNKGEILALLGENGSGKTTLMNMLSGIYKPDEGEIFINGEKVVIQSPEDSKRLGIGMVHQHFKLVEKFSAADNILIGSDNEDGIDRYFLRNQRYDKIREMSRKFGFDIDPEKCICDMGVSEKQTVEILKVLYYGANVLILDEPTAVLTLQEKDKLFSILRKMKKSGCAIIIITHKLNEVLEISDRVTILRKGEWIGTVDTDKTNAKELTDMMVGRAVELAIDRPQCRRDEVLLKMEGVTVPGESGLNAVEDISFELYSGEILGVAGVSGCGQKELCEVIAGLQKLSGGKIIYKDTEIQGKSPREIINMGISMSFVPEDRLGMGLAASLSITDNMMLKSYGKVKGPFVDRKTTRETAKRVIKELEINTPGTETAVRKLSGGNVQKVLVGREIESSPSVIVTAYPVRGLDINSSYIIYDILNEQKKKGTGVLFVGEDLDVMLELCDRIMVLCHGKVTGILDAKEATKEKLGLLMTNASEVETVSSERKNEADSGEVEFEFKEKVARKSKVPKEPLIHLIKRDILPLWKTSSIYAMAVLVALVLGGVLVAVNGANPISYYVNILVGCFKNSINLNGLIRQIIPLTITSLGIAFAFKMKFWNVGGEGQFIAGAISAAAVAHLFRGVEDPSNIVVLLCMFLAGAIGGGIVGLIPAVLKVKFGTNETLLTLMLNYIVLYFFTFLKKTYYFGQLNNGVPNNRDFAALEEYARLPQIRLGGITFDVSLIVALVLVAVCYVYFKKTKQGYEISIVGDSINTAKYAGMNVSKIIIRTMFISAAVIGIAGMFQVSGIATSYRLSTGITSEVGWTGVIVAWLSKLNPIGILVTSFLMCILSKGAGVAESAFSISPAVSSILQGIILFSVLAADFFINYRLVLNLKAKNEGGKK